MTAVRDPLSSCVHLVNAQETRAHAEDDRATLARLYAEHSPSIYRFLRDLLRDPALAADATQETFVRAFRRIDTLREAGRVAPWLFGVARNVSLELRKARYRANRVFAPECQVTRHGELSASACATAEGSPESELLGQEALRVVATAMGRLEEDRRAVLLLRLDHGLAYEEIADLMGWTLAKVKVEIHRAREVLRATMAEYEEGGAR